MENGHWYDFSASDIEIEKNAQAFLRAIEDGSPRAVARHVDFPLTTFIGKRTVKIRNAKEFLRLYDRILPSGTSERARMAPPHDMFVHRGNAMVLNGEVWFSARGAVSVFFSRMPPKTTGTMKLKARSSCDN